MIADRSRAAVPDLDRFIKGKSRRDRNKELTVVPSVRGQLAEVLQEELQ
jgi:hypothetical protein